MYARFRKDPYLLQRYNVVSTATLLILLAGALLLREGPFLELAPWLPVAALFAHSSFRSVLWGFGLSIALFALRPALFAPGAALLLLAVGFFVGIWSNVLIHNASHNNIKPAWLNRLVGELTGLQVLSGFPGFSVLHMEHHRHSDDEELDPHPNLPGQTFFHYVDGTRGRLRETFARMYRECWGHNPAYLASWRRVKLLLPLNRALRAAFLLALIGPLSFTFGFVFSHLVTQLAFAVINFYSHQRREDGSIEIRNLDGHWSFWILNRGFAGAFYHRNHHLNPKLFNPMRMRSGALRH